MIQSRKSYHDIPHYPLETRIVTRVYAGPLRRYARYSALRDSMYGPEYPRIKIIWDLEIRWANFPVLPPRLPPDDPHGIIPSPWLPAGFERTQERNAFYWYDDYLAKSPETQQSHYISPEHAENLIPRADGNLATVIGPWGNQKEFHLSQGSSISLSQSGLPVDDPDSKDKTPSGWMLDLGGIPLAMGWAPSASKTAQVLAVATIPFADQEPMVQQKEKAAAAGEKQPDTVGCIQFWEFTADHTDGGLPTPSTALPSLLMAKFFDWGRPKRLQWCPVSFEKAGLHGLLAILCGDGKARVIDVKRVADTDYRPQFEWIDSPIVTLDITEDYNVSVTCLTWVNTNRIALGHSDGTVTLWSIFPRRMLQRVGVHTTYVIDICSAYPSNPYLVASIPVGGCATLTDLTQPSSELTYFPVPAISFQPNMLCWNESMQGFLALYPSSTPNTTIAFLHHRFFCQARSTCTGPNTLTCISTGSTHPFILAGCADGSIFSCNALQKLFKQKGEPLRKIKIFEHEYRPVAKPTITDDAMTPPPPHSYLRGASRILHGFLPEPNDDPRTEKRKEMDRRKKEERKKKASTTASGKKKGRPSKKDKEAAAAAAARGEATPAPEAVPVQNKEVDEEMDREAELADKLASRVVTHEPLTRVTAIVWNPNTLFSCWAACSMASGMLKVMDLGVQ